MTIDRPRSRFASGSQHVAIARRAIVALLLAGLAWFYVAAAGRHATSVNTVKSRADQTGYLVDAKRVYANWHGQEPPFLIGERMRMPVYAGFLALAYSPSISDDQFFEVAKRWNIRLSLACLVALGIVFTRFLPPLPAFNLTLIVAFGYFVFRAGYAQPELLSYTLFFFTFLSCCLLLEAREVSRTLRLAITAGVLGGLTHLTKAVMPPFLGAYCVVFVLQEMVRRRSAAQQTAVRASPGVATRLLSLALMLAVFLAVVFPYIATSRRVFGEYFFNHNTAYYIWFDTGAQARAVMLPHTDENGVVHIAADQLPSMRTYLRAHTVAQIATRFREGFADMVLRSYTTFWYYPFVLLFAGGTAAAFILERDRAGHVLREHWALALFLVLYGITFLLSTAFFSTISGTGTARFLLAHVTPLFFVLSSFLSRVRVRGFHVAVSALLAWSIAFVIWPRLMLTYGGF